MAEFMGYMVNGAWEDRSEVGTEALIRIPDGVSYAQAAAATDGGMTSVGALTTAGVQAGMKVASSASAVSARSARASHICAAPRSTSPRSTSRSGTAPARPVR